MSVSARTSRLDARCVRVGDGFPPVIALTSLSPLASGDVLIGATSRGSAQPVLLRLNPRALELADTGFRFPPKGAQGTYACSVGDKIHNGIVHGNGPLAGQVLIGHGSHIWWDSGGWPFHPGVFPGGAVYAFDPQTHRSRSLGIPSALNVIHGLFGGEGFAVGYSLPDNHFFSVDYASGEMMDFGRLGAPCAHRFACHGHRAFGAYRRSVGVQRGDRVLNDEHAAFLFVYDHRVRSLTRTTVLAGDLRTDIRFNVGIDSMLATRHGVLGGRVDGTLFLLDPDSLAIRELGHAVQPPRVELSAEQVRRLGGAACRQILGCERITALAALDEGLVIGAAGFPTMHLFLLELPAGRKVDLGPVHSDQEMCYFHDLALVRQDGGRWTVVVSETDSGNANLYVMNDFDPKASL